MAELIEIKRVVIGPENLTASVRLADDAPIMTSEDLEGTTYVYRLMPHIVEHTVEGEEGGIFRDVMGSTNLADLLAHVTIELLEQTELVQDVPVARAWADGNKRRAFKIEMSCADDVLVATALSCGAWIMEWAYRGASDPDPDIEAIVAGLVQLIENVGKAGENLVIDYDAPKPPEEEDASDGEQDAVDVVDEFDAEEAADHTGQIDFSKQYVFGKQRGLNEDAEDEDDAFAGNDEPLDADSTQLMPRLVIDEYQKEINEEREAALEAEIDRLMSSSPEELESMFGTTQATSGFGASFDGEADAS